MKILLGRRLHEMEPEALSERMRGCFPVHVDVGTGSGRLVLKRALKDRGGFYIGMDASAQGMYESSVKAAKCGRKAGLDNLLFLVAPVEALPEGVAGIADAITVILP